MLKKPIKYIDYNGDEREEVFLFNLSKAEVMEMEFGIVGGLGQKITKIVAEKDSPSLVMFFKDFILRSYGEKSPDGRRFMKTPEITTAFAQTEAYSDLFIELSSNSEAASAFIRGVIPESLQDAMKEAEAEAKAEPKTGLKMI